MGKKLKSTQKGVKPLEMKFVGESDEAIFLEVKENGKWECYEFNFVKHFEIIKPLLKLIPEPEDE